MMSKKTKRLYQRMQYGIDKKSEASRRLEEKFQQLESESKTDNSSNERNASKKKTKRKESVDQSKVTKSKKTKTS